MPTVSIKPWSLGSDHYLQMLGPRGGLRHVELLGNAIEQARGIDDAPKLRDALEAAWSFIENVTDDDPARQAKFFDLRAKVREALRD